MKRLAPYHAIRVLWSALNAVPLLEGEEVKVSYLTVVHAWTPSFSGRTQPSLAPLLALTTRRNFDSINDGFKFSVSTTINTLVTLSLSLLQCQVGLLRLGLHKSWRRRRSQV